MFYINNENFVIFAANNYEQRNCLDVVEFHDDLKRIKYIKRLFNKFEKDQQDLKERLILNHLTILYNVFDRQPLTHMLCFKLGKYLKYLKPFLLYLNYWPEKIQLNNKIIIGSDIPLDPIIVKKLRDLK